MCVAIFFPTNGSEISEFALRIQIRICGSNHNRKGGKWNSARCGRFCAAISGPTLPLLASENRMKHASMLDVSCADLIFVFVVFSTLSRASNDQMESLASIIFEESRIFSRMFRPNLLFDLA